MSSSSESDSGYEVDFGALMSSQNTELHQAVESYSTTWVKKLLKKPYVNPNAMNSKNQTALELALLHMQYNMRFMTRGCSTATSVTSDLLDIVHQLVSRTNVIALSASFPQSETVFGLSLRCDILTISHTDMSCSVLLVRHGVMPSFKSILSVAVRQRHMLSILHDTDSCDFFTYKFVKFLRLAGVHFHDSAELWQIIPDGLFQTWVPFLTAVKLMRCQPLTLQACCGVVVRRSLVKAGDILWRNVDALVLPPSIKCALKIVCGMYDDPMEDDV